MHVIFDEANFTLPLTKAPAAPLILQQLHYKSDQHDPLESDATHSLVIPTEESHDELQVQDLLPHALLPCHATDGAAGYNLHSDQDCLL